MIRRIVIRPSRHDAIVQDLASGDDGNDYAVEIAPSIASALIAAKMAIMPELIDRRIQ
jgi:hypothetical protein